MIMIGHWLWHPLIQFARSHLESPPSFRMCLPNNNHQKALGLCACDLYVNSQWESEIRKGLRNEISTPAVSWPAILCEGEREKESKTVAVVNYVHFNSIIYPCFRASPGRQAASHPGSDGGW